MPDPIIVQRMNAYRAALLRQEATQMQDMTTRWLAVERNLTQSITDVLAEIARRQAAGEIFGRDMGPYVRLTRYRELLNQVRVELRKFGRYTEDLVTAGIADHVALGVEHSTAAIETLAGGELSAFNRLPVAAAENMAAALQADAPVGQLLAGAWPDASVRMTEALMNGVASGWNPRKTARSMREGLQAGALQRSLTIARTEQLRAYRTASLESYRNSGVVKGYKRLAAKSTRTCIACLMADGTFYPLGESFDAHPNCRCTLVAVLAFGDEPTWETGREWFAKQPVATQRQLLGPATYEAWQAKAIRLEDLVERHEHPVWGGSLGQRSLRSLLGADEARRYLPKPVRRALLGTSGAAPTLATASSQTLSGLNFADGQKVRQDIDTGIKRYKEQRKRLFNQQDKVKQELRECADETRLPELQAKADKLTKKIARLDSPGKLSAIAHSAIKLPDPEDIKYNRTNRLNYEYSPSFLAAGKMDKDTAKKYRDAQKFVRNIAKADVLPGKVLVEYNPAKRAFARPGSIHVNFSTSIDTIVHELIHQIEYTGDSFLRDKRLAFYNERTKGDSLEKLADAYPSRGYLDNEVFKRDKWHKLYMGKLYDNDEPREMLTMGVQWLYTNPIEFMRTDPDHFDFVIGFLRGTL